MLPIRLVLAAIFTAATLGTVHAQAPPEDGDRYSIVIVDQSPATPFGERVAAMLDAAPLRAIAAQCHRHTFTPSSPLYRERYAAAIPPSVLPVIALVRPDGGVLYKASGPAIPSAADLAAAFTHRATIDQSNADRFTASATTLIGLPSRPLLRPLDRVIPDSITVTPTVSIDGSIPAAVVIALGLAAVLLVVIIAAGVIGTIVYLRR